MADVVRDTTIYKSTDGTPVHTVIAHGSDSLEIVSKFTIPNESDVASIFRLCEVPSNFIVLAGNIQYDGGTSAGTLDVGLYETTEHGGEVIDADMFIADADFTSSGSTSILTALAIGDLDKTLYELAAGVGTRDDVSSSRQSYVIGASVATAATATADTVCVLKVSLVRKS